MGGPSGNETFAGWHGSRPKKRQKGPINAVRLLKINNLTQKQTQNKPNSKPPGLLDSMRPWNKAKIQSRQVL